MAAIALCAFAVAGIRAGSGDRTVSIYNIHTKETLTTTFKRDGAYDKAALADFNNIMRDWRVDEAVEMDPGLLDLLWELHTELGSNKPIHLISGHRSEKTNEMLRRTRGGQAKKSLHIRGLASDVYFPDVPLERLRNAALVRQRGGVGYYPRSGQPFVHVDTGRVRHWPRIPEDQLAAIMKNKGNYIAPTATEERAVRVASAEVEFDTPAPRPRLKPEFAAGSDSADAEPLLVASAGESALLPTHRAAPQFAATGRDWGQSWLLPSASSAVTPRGKPSPVGTAGAARVIVTASSAPVAKGDAPLAANLAFGYAGSATDGGRGRAASLLDNGTGDLARLLAEAQLIDGQTPGSANGPTDLRPSVLLHTRAEMPSRRPAAYLPPPVMTASLGPAMHDPLPAPRLARTLTSDFGGPTLAPRVRPQLKSSPKLITALLTAPAGEHSITFAKMGAKTVETSFAAPSGPTLWQASLRDYDSASQPGLAGELVDLAERAFGWIFGE